jgi:Fe-Mn family superoxide dismutase
MKIELPRLPFKMESLEPYISSRTIGFHHGKHHQAYISDLNELIAGTRYENIDLETIIKVAEGPLLNNAAQAWNHTFYFAGLKPGNNKGLNGSLSLAIDKCFGSTLTFKDMFTESAVELFGSGWVWLIFNSTGSLEITQENNTGNPLRLGVIPLMNCDVWEHAYYLDYQNKRQEYLAAFWKLVNWEIIEKRYNTALFK